MRHKIVPLQTDVEEKEEVLVITARLESGKFESTIRIPLNSSEQQQKEFIESWLALMATGLKLGSKL